MSFRFQSKAQTLQALTGHVTNARVLPLVIVRHDLWKLDRNLVLNQISNKFVDKSLIIRSSSTQEDQFSGSLAGMFLTKQDVELRDVGMAVDDVFASYGILVPEDEVLVQPMLKSVVRSGVAFSHDPNTCAPYRTINWHEGQDTSMVTSGRGGELWLQAAGTLHSAERWVQELLGLIEELIELTNYESLDCEFAISQDGAEQVIWLLQVRPLLLTRDPDSNSNLHHRLRVVEEYVSRVMRPHPFLYGSKTIFGIMPDWNPAEIVGVRPQPLALSLYRELVTDSVWAYQRHNYGYRNLRSFPLMAQFWGQPYIDVRVSFNSFVPADIDDDLGEKLVEYYLSYLEKNPNLHDKIEFEIVLSCYSFDIKERLEKLRYHGFQENQCERIKRSLRKLTNEIINNKHGRWLEDQARVAKLENRRTLLLQSAGSELEHIYWLLEDGKRYGTLPFAGLARAAFIAVQMLNSLVLEGVLSDKDRTAFMSSLRTVSSEMVYDRQSLSKQEFLRKYGHLRPGTYDIRSPRYDEEPDLYFDWNESSTRVVDQLPFSIESSQTEALGKLLLDHGLESTPHDFFFFCRRAIELRESSKFEFTKNLSKALSLLEHFGKDLGFSKDEMSFCDIKTILQAYGSASDHKKILEDSIEVGMRHFEHTSRLSLPSLICSPADIWAFSISASEPNFITQKVVTAPVIQIPTTKPLRDTIVVIPSADPGYDWLFSHGIAGLITEWGGANSHMAIRAGELGIPAVIGAGELLFRRWAGARQLRIDCATRHVEVID